MSKRLLACGVSAFAVFATSVAAQQIGPPSTLPEQSVQQVGEAPAAATPAESNSALQASEGDIVVTANRNESLASKTPIALTAITGTALLSAGITNPTTLG